MKTKHLKLLTLAVLASCTTGPVQDVKPATSGLPVSSSPTVVSTSPVVQVPVPAKTYKTPAIKLPHAPSSAMIQAAKYFADYANSDEFYEYVKKNVPKKLEGGNESDRDVAIAVTRECLNKMTDVEVRWKNYGVWPLYKSAAIGGWVKGGIVNQNPRMSLTEIERAGHWFHEIGTHGCGFTHIDNNIKLYPIIRNSWPYQGGYAFEDFLTEKTKRKLAAE